jgi:prepilin-type N-terminal cleavage/methylation domain-containing protein
MFTPKKKCGFTLLEVKFALLILVVIALFVIPKIKATYDDRRADATIRDVFTQVGEGYNAYKASVAPSVPVVPENTDATNPAGNTFAQYLQSNLNYTSLSVPTGANTYCTYNANGYILLPSGAMITQVCDLVGAPLCPVTVDPSTLCIQTRIDMTMSNGTTTNFHIVSSYTLDRYTTWHGAWSTAAASYADQVLNIP